MRLFLTEAAAVDRHHWRESAYAVRLAQHAEPDDFQLAMRD